MTYVQNTYVTGIGFILSALRIVTSLTTLKE